MDKIPYRINFFEKGYFVKGLYIDKSFNKFLDNIHFIKYNVPTVEKKGLLLVLPYFGVISLQTTTKLQQAFKGVLNYCKLEIAVKYQTKFSNSFRSKDPIPKDLISDVVYKFTVVSAMHPIMARVSSI